MAASTVSPYHQPGLTAQQIAMLNATATVSTPSSGNTPSPMCSTPATTVLCANGYRPIVPYAGLAPPVVANVYEGNPIYLTSHSSHCDSLSTDATNAAAVTSSAAYQRTVVSFPFFPFRQHFMRICANYASSKCYVY
ncbi:unnamed protein product [Gongylonema pulchrum]|uniref:Protein muscleblind n=1 Tax=Gongylonema pulchrum TaxID=637853 RepID=A0A183EUG2_9BILA|nr:unnamed protein product [Gongylonema pulchrum]